MNTQIDILENEILEAYPEVLDMLLYDHTTQRNIIWATSNYEYLGENYINKKEIKPELITGTNGNVIMTRVQKDSVLQLSRVKKMAEVFTPSWICNAQNNLIDKSWFQRENIFNIEIKGNKWKTIKEKITFPNNKTWKDYIRDKRLEIACGEAPYITSRYDATNGEFIEVEDRIGLLDRKLRIINENVKNLEEWISWAEIAYENTYAYEWQGDSLLLARESMLYTFIENYKYKFRKEPSLKSIQTIANIISWNVWQMDGLKSVVPLSCTESEIKTINLFGEEEKVKSFCKGCLTNDMFKHNGIYCIIKDWSIKNEVSGKKGQNVRFIDLVKK